MRFLINWIDDRTGVRRLAHEALFENIPGGARWRYVWGSTLTFAIFIQFVTGIMLWMFYSPSATSAWESVYYIQNKLPAGDWLRGIHHWTSQFMIVLLVLHLVQVLVDGAYKAPREFNFWFGLILLAITLGLGLTGYLLPWDQKGYWATEVATNIVGATPFIGDQLKQLMIGGAEAGHHTLTRFFALHAGVLPAALVGMIILHIYLFRKHGITSAPTKSAASVRHFWWVALLVMLFAQAMLVWNWQYVSRELGIGISVVTGIVLLRVMFLQLRKKPIEEEYDRKPRPGDAYFWPDQILRDAVACAVLLGAILFFVWQFGTELSAPADPSENYSAARPDWYFMSLFALLKDFDLVTGAFIIPGVVAAVVFLMPFLGRWKTGHAFNLVFIAAVLGGFVYNTMVAFRHDWRSPEHLAAVEAAHRDAERVKVLAESPDGIPPEGAVTLLRKDPYTRGPELFAANCASCHVYDGHDGMGLPVDKQSASDLKGFASRAWTKGILDADTFASKDFLGATELIEDSEMHEFLQEDLSDLDEIGQKEVALMALALSAEAQLPHQAAIDARDAEQIEEGRELLMDDLAYGCTDCHQYRGEGTKGIDLTGYGSREWQLAFIKNPEHPRFYGSGNDRMPVFGPKYGEDGELERPAQLTDEEIGLIVDWLRGDWWDPEHAEHLLEQPEDGPPAGEG